MAKDVPIEVIQNCEFEILKYIRDVCDRNGLRYYLAYGTLIGAVRHQGFIPWDDDMDIHMPREDYLKFVEIVTANPHPYYRLIAKETSKDYTYLWAKMVDTRTEIIPVSNMKQGTRLGLFVDIFILDGAGNSLEEAEALYQKAFAIYVLYRRAAKTMFNRGESKMLTFLRWIKHIPERTVGIRYWMNKHDAFCIQQTYDNCKYVSAFGAGTRDPSRNIWERDYFGNGTNVIFNGELFLAPNRWDDVLKPEYGDYMVLPPAEERHSNHRHIPVLDSFLIEEFSSKK